MDRLKIDKRIKSFSDKDYIRIGKEILDLSSTIREPFNISLVVDDRNYIIMGVETLRAQRFKNRMLYDGDGDYDDSIPPESWERGIL